MMKNGGSWRSQIAPTAFDGRYSVPVGQVPALQVTLRYGKRGCLKMNETPSKKNNYLIFIVGGGLCAAPIGVFAAFFGMAHRPFPTYAF